MASSTDYYQLLGVSKNANDQELKTAYRKAALQWHPDRNKDPKAADKFKEINQAYEVLSNPEKRQTYDQFGADAFSGGGQQGPFGGGFGGQQGPFSYTYRTYGSGPQGGNPFEGMDFGGFSDPFDIFEQFFGGGFSPGGQRRARRQVYSLSLSFMEAVKGVEKTIQIGGKNMTIKVPAGVDNGSRIRYGDFDIVVAVSPDKTFQRDGADLTVTADVSFPQAVLGTTIKVPTLNEEVNLKVPAGTQPDAVIRLRGHGVKLPQSNHTGDLYVKIKVKIPTKISKDQKKLLEEFDDGSNKRGGWF